MGALEAMTEFREILVLGSARSGSNLLCSILREVRESIGLFEIFSHQRVEGLQWHPALEARVSSALSIPGESADSVNLLAKRNSDPVGFFDALSRCAQDEGARSMTCKIFGNQITILQLDAILRRPNICVIFLSRRRIDRYISAEKARISGEYLKANSTGLRPTLDIVRFLRSVFDDDRHLEAKYQSVTGFGVPYACLNYERDLDIEEERRKARISDALKSIGISEGIPHARPENWLVKQDDSADWRAKIANGFQAAAALAGCGLLDYAEEAPLASAGSNASAASPASLPDFDGLGNPLERQVTCAVLSLEPLVTISSIQHNRSPTADFMSTTARAFGDRKGLHFLRPSWSMERSSLVSLAQTIQEAEALNPGHAFVALHASDREADRYTEHRIRSIPGNSNIFADERIWAEDAPPVPGLETADALYIARLSGWKNHHLAVRLQRPLFVYGKRELIADPDLLDKYRKQLPTAQFVNHVLGDGSHKQLSHALLARVMSSARVGLALSQVEGVMRASMECLLSGLPLVNVSSIGGRAAFLSSSNSVTVDPTPEAVEAGVSDLVSRRLTRREVRCATLGLVEDARRAFLQAANLVLQSHFGPGVPALGFEPLLGHINRYRALSEFIEALR
jgi:glycosyltransferase involved in cell wall biosynthesis